MHANAAPRDTRWVQRLIDEERAPALWLLIAAILGIAFANLAPRSALDQVLSFGPASMPLSHFAGEGLLVVFFLVAGLELRHELTVGSLNTPRAAAVPIIAAAFGMVVPALLFIALGPDLARAAWGVPMATDLPIALALLAVAGRGLPAAFRAFLLSLAIVDDALSILVVAIAFGSHVSLPWLLGTAVLVGVYARTVRRSGVRATIVALAAWLAMLQTGIHPTVLGVALGLSTSRDVDAIRERWQPVAAYVAVPMFVAIALAIPVEPGSLDPHLIGALSAARILGKPLGIWLGALLAVHLLRPDEVLPGRLYAAAGSVAGVGFSVSVLFADLTLEGSDLFATLLAVLIALAASALVAVGALRTLRSSYQDR